MNIYQQSNFMKGMTYAGFSTNVFHTPASDDSLKRLRNTGVNWVALNVGWWQMHSQAHEILPHESKTPTDASVLHIIDLLHQMGIQVMLKPIVDSRDDIWRGMFEPKNYRKWFRYYTRFILHYAALAEKGKVDLFCIGCENILGGLAGRKSWRRLIPKIKELYSGPLTYASNFDRRISYKHVPFWDLLDYIGIDAYFPLRSTRDSQQVPHLQELVQSWNSYFRQIENWRRMNQPEKDILFTEIGVASYLGASKEPFAYPANVEESWEEQAKYYDACFIACSDRPWLKGLFWWWWDNPSTSDYMMEGAQYRTHYTPQGKPAEEILKKWFLYT